MKSNLYLENLTSINTKFSSNFNILDVVNSLNVANAAAQDTGCPPNVVICPNDGFLLNPRGYLTF